MISIGDIVEVYMEYMMPPGFKQGRVCRITESFSGETLYEIHGYKNKNKKDDCFITCCPDRLIRPVRNIALAEKQQMDIFA